MSSKMRLLYLFSLSTFSLYFLILLSNAQSSEQEYNLDNYPIGESITLSHGTYNFGTGTLTINADNVNFKKNSDGSFDINGVTVSGSDITFDGSSFRLNGDGKISNVNVRDVENVIMEGKILTGIASSDNSNVAGVTYSKGVKWIYNPENKELIISSSDGNPVTIAKIDSNSDVTIKKVESNLILPNQLVLEEGEIRVSNNNYFVPKNIMAKINGETIFNNQNNVYVSFINTDINNIDEANNEQLLAMYLDAQTRLNEEINKGSQNPDLYSQFLQARTSIAKKIDLVDGSKEAFKRIAFRDNYIVFTSYGYVAGGSGFEIGDKERSVFLDGGSVIKISDSKDGVILRGNGIKVNTMERTITPSGVERNGLTNSEDMPGSTIQNIDYSIVTNADDRTIESGKQIPEGQEKLEKIEIKNKKFREIFEEAGLDTYPKRKEWLENQEWYAAIVGNDPYFGTLEQNSMILDALRDGEITLYKSTTYRATVAPASELPYDNYFYKELGPKGKKSYSALLTNAEEGTTKARDNKEIQSAVNLIATRFHPESVLGDKYQSFFNYLLAMEIGGETDLERASGDEPLFSGCDLKGVNCGPAQATRETFDGAVKVYSRQISAVTGKPIVSYEEYLKLPLDDQVTYSYVVNQYNYDIVTAKFEGPKRFQDLNDQLYTFTRLNAHNPGPNDQRVEVTFSAVNELINEAELQGRDPKSITMEEVIARLKQNLGDPDKLRDTLLVDAYPFVGAQMIK